MQITAYPHKQFVCMGWKVECVFGSKKKQNEFVYVAEDISIEIKAPIFLYSKEIAGLLEGGMSSIEMMEIKAFVTYLTAICKSQNLRAKEIFALVCWNSNTKTKRT